MQVFLTNCPEIQKFHFGHSGLRSAHQKLDFMFIKKLFEKLFGFQINFLHPLDNGKWFFDQILY